MTIHADAVIRAGLFTGDERPSWHWTPSASPTCTWCAAGLRVNDRQLRAGDAARLDQEARLLLEGGEDAEVLVFDLAP